MTREQLGMDAVDVVALFEGVHDDLPIAVDGFADIHHGGELVEVVGRQQLGHLGPRNSAAAPRRDRG